MIPAIRRVRHRESGKFAWAALDADGNHAGLFNEGGLERWAGGEDPSDGDALGDPVDWLDHPVLTSGTVFAFAETYYEEGSRERRSKNPMLFIKPASSVAPEEAVVPVGELLAGGARIWGEGEIGLYVGPSGRPIGLTLVNDVTMEMPGYEDQDHHLPFLKGQFGFCPCSSILLPLSEWDDHHLVNHHDGELIRQGCRTDFIYSVEELWDWLTGWCAPFPGDLMLMGAPRRVRPRLYAEIGTTFTAVLNDRWRLETVFG
jgi:2-keto-4-pentenoate hydratase/2-oxohepta-3-ene-1,7-dioic acid hydratase in catechol pathway